MVPDHGEFVYVFNHIPRTGGGALATLLASVLRPVYDYPGPTEPEFARWLATPVALGLLGAGDLLVGHYTAPGGFLFQRYPDVFDPSRYRLITVLREPWAWLCSLLRYFGRERLGFDSDEDASTRLAGLYSRVLEIPGDSAQDALSAYWFVGTTENLQSAADQLLYAWHKPPRQLSAINLSASRLAYVPPASSPSDYLQAAASDVELYRAAVIRSRAGGLKDSRDAS